MNIRTIFLDSCSINIFQNQVFAPAQDAETFIDELPRTIEEKNRRFGDAVLGLKMGKEM